MITQNEYFDGRVRSLGFQTADKLATIGVMAPGEYRFSTTTAESVTVVSGALGVTLPGADEARCITAGERFEVPGDSAFDVRVAVASAYLCLYG